MPIEDFRSSDDGLRFPKGPTKRLYYRPDRSVISNVNFGARVHTKKSVNIFLDEFFEVCVAVLFCSVCLTQRNKPKSQVGLVGKVETIQKL